MKLSGTYYFPVLRNDSGFTVLTTAPSDGLVVTCEGKIGSAIINFLFQVFISFIEPIGYLSICDKYQKLAINRTELLILCVYDNPSLSLGLLKLCVLLYVKLILSLWRDIACPHLGGLVKLQSAHKKLCVVNRKILRLSLYRNSVPAVTLLIVVHLLAVLYGDTKLSLVDVRLVNQSGLICSCSFHYCILIDFTGWAGWLSSCSR